MARNARQRRRSERGAAMLMAVVSVAVLTALATELAYQTQVRLRIAANARDELRASAQAQSAVAMARLVLAFQQEIDRMSGAVCTAQNATGGAAACPPSPQLWKLVPIGSALTRSLFVEGAAEEEGAAREGDAPRRSSDGPPVPAARTAPTDLSDGFEARVEDEGAKINVQYDIGTTVVLALRAQSLLRAVCEAKWDPLFDRTDADGQRYSRSDLLVHLHDWVDENNTSSSLVASFPGDNCSATVSGKGFEDAFSDENYPYDRGRDRYKAKNARFTSLEELHLVAGVSDALMAAFGDQLTVYVPKNGKLNVNAEDPLRVALLLAEPASAAQLLLSRELQEKYLKQRAISTMGGTMATPETQVFQDMEAVGLKVRGDIVAAAKGTSSPLTSASDTFRIRATGKAGDVTHEIDAVVTFEQSLQAPEDQPVPGAAPSDKPKLGALIHWRED